MYSVHDYYHGVLITNDNDIPNSSIIYNEITGLGIGGPTCHFGLYFKDGEESYVIDWDKDRECPCIKRSLSDFKNSKNIYLVPEKDDKINNMTVRTEEDTLKYASSFLNKNYFKYDVAFANCEQFVFRCKNKKYKKVNMTLPEHINFNNITNLSEDEKNKWTNDSIQSKNVLKLLCPIMSLNELFINAFK